MKRRLLVMTEHRKIQNFRFWLIVPMLVSALVCFGFTVKKDNVREVLNEVTEVLVKGRIVDDGTGHPIYGASVIEVGRTNGTLAGKVGEFQLKTSRDRVLQFAMKGYDSRLYRVEELMGSYVEIRMRKP